jgi:hypothetical protein
MAVQTASQAQFAGTRVRRAGSEWLVRGLCALCGMGSVAPLLAWGFGWGSFQAWFWGVAVPSQMALLVVGLTAREAHWPRLHTALRAGVIGGIVGTFGYDLFRIPFEAAGLRVFLPIDSYGILLVGERTSTPLTVFLGWAYHFSNGIGFGVTYACIALGRRWLWALLWAMLLESAFILTPLGHLYGIQGKWVLIAIAYGGHLAYGAPLGKIVETAGDHTVRLKVPVPASWAFAALVIYLAALHQPFATTPEDAAGRALSSTVASAVVSGGQFHPLWVRTAVGGCAVVRNEDHVTYQLSSAVANPTLLPGRTTTVCFDQPGIVRVRTASTPYSGGVALVDPGMPR